MIPTEMIHYGMTQDRATRRVARPRRIDSAAPRLTVNSVLPGPTMSEGVETFVADLARQNGQSEQDAAAQFIKQHRPGSLIQRFASVEEIASMAVYVSSKEASATNGAALRGEGGDRPDHRLRCNSRSRHEQATRRDADRMLLAMRATMQANACELIRKGPPRRPFILRVDHQWR